LFLQDVGVNENADPNNNSAGENNGPENQMPSTSNAGRKRKHSPTMDGEPFTKMKKGKIEQESKLENNVNEKKTFQKLKNKFSKLEVMKGKKEKKLQIENKSKDVAQSKNEKSNSVTKPVSEKTGKDVEKNLDKNKKEHNAVTKDTPKVVTVSAEVPASFKKQADKKSPDTLKKKGKRTHSQSANDDTNSTNDKISTPIAQNLGTVPSITVQEPTPIVKSGTPATKSPAVSNGLQDGEVEIWIPNKKYKGNKDTNITPKANFASFDQSRPPVAFVKRSLSKSLKKTPSSQKTPTASGVTGSAKRVSFDMKKNKAQGKKF
jgi:hypothetical protein